MITQYTLLKLDQYNEYTTLCYDGETIGFFESFLRDTPIGDAQFYIEWALNQRQDYQVTGQLACLYKRHNTIYIGSLFSTPEEQGPFFEISINQFINVLIKWEELLKTKSNRIMLSVSSDGNMTIEGDNSL